MKEENKAIERPRTEKDPAKYHPYRPQPHRYAGFSRAVLAAHIARLWKYRPRYRPSRISSVCWPFSLVMAPAVDTGGIFLSLRESVLYMYPFAETIPMHLVSDYIHPTPRGGKCRIRVYLPEDEQDAPVVISSSFLVCPAPPLS
jgi:hypothetical protein